MADKQKLVQQSATEADYTPCVAVSGESETTAPHIVVDVDDGKTTTQNDKSPLI